MAKKERSETDKLGPYLCFLLRHQPEAAGLSLDRYGYAVIEELIEAVNQSGKYTLDRALLAKVVSEDEKGRYMYDETGTKLRACQGHSIPVELELTPVAPPELLYHGTALRFVDPILQTGLQKGNRQYVHLSPDHETAVKVGSRHGEPFVFWVEAGRMQKDGFVFYKAHNGVWLTDYVPREYLKFEE